MAGGKAAKAPLPAAVSSRLQSALQSGQQQQQQQQQQQRGEAMLRDLEQTVSTGRRFVIGHTVALAAIFVSLVGLVLYTRGRWRQRRLDNSAVAGRADCASSCSESSVAATAGCLRF